MPRTICKEGVSWLSSALQKLSMQSALCSFERRPLPPCHRSRQRSGVVAAAFLSAARLRTPQWEADLCPRFDPVLWRFRPGLDDRTSAVADVQRMDGQDVAARDHVFVPGLPRGACRGSYVLFWIALALASLCCRWDEMNVTSQGRGSKTRHWCGREISACSSFPLMLSSVGYAGAWLCCSTFCAHGCFAQCL